jgi:transposase-like protein
VSLKKRKFNPEQKATIVRRHLRGKEPVSKLAEEFSIQPTQIHQWVALVLEKVEQVFEKSSKTGKPRHQATALERKEQQIQRLEEKIVHKNEVIAELMEENVKAKKATGDL